MNRPDQRELDAEIRAHLALSIQERIERGEDPADARRAALEELGYIPQVRESMRGVWYSRWSDRVASLADDVRVALRSLGRAKGLAATVAVTLALGIGANAAIFSVVRGVLLSPLVNRGEDRLVYVRQAAPGLAHDSTAFSVPEIADFRAGATTISAFGEFSTVSFTMLGLGEPRVVQAGVVNGSYFDVMGLRPSLGRLLTPTDDGFDAAPVAVLTHRFWTSALNADPSVIDRTVRLGSLTAKIVGILEPALPYPVDTEIIANVVTSPHHLEATMVTSRTHRMTQLFGRLAPGASVETARAELTSLHKEMMRRHPGAYPASARIELAVTPLRDQVTAPARTILLVLLAAAGIVFVIACSNVANLILARSVQRQGELAVRAALGASRGALRRSLLVESVLLCGAGAALGILIARPLLSIVARLASRYSVRALDVTVDATLLWVSAGLAMIAAVLLAYIPRLPSAHSPAGSGPSAVSVRITPGTKRRLRVFATVQIAFSFVLLAGAGTLLTAVVALQSAETGYDMRQVLAIDLPNSAIDLKDGAELALHEDMMRRIDALPDVDGVALGVFVPWRDAGALGPGFRFTVEGRARAAGDEDPHGRFRVVSPGFFKVVGVPIIAGRDFTQDDRDGAERVAIISQSIARLMFADGDALNRTLRWTDPYFDRLPLQRIVGIVADVDDEHVVRRPALTVYHPVRQVHVAGRLFVHATGDPYELVPQVRQIVREVSADQPVERAATLGDVRAEVLAPERLNAIVLAIFAGVALLIAVVGVAGVLAFSVSARMHEFGLLLSLGATPRRLLVRVLSEGALIAGIGIVTGALGAYTFAGVAAGMLDGLRLPGLPVIAGAAFVLAAAAVIASVTPAVRASRVDVLQALRSE